MPTYPQALVRALLSTLGGLAFGCAVMAFLIGAYFQASGPQPVGSLSAGWAAGPLVSAFALAYGTLPALMVGAPLYALLLHRGWDTYLGAVSIGILPGLALLAFERELAFLFVTYGASVAACTHLVASRLRSWHRVDATRPCVRAGSGEKLS